MSETLYFVDSQSQILRRDRRSRPRSPYEGDEHREAIKQAELLTLAQVEVRIAGLLQALADLERARARVGKRARWARHLFVWFAFATIAVAAVGPSFHIDIKSVPVTFVELAVIGPWLVPYAAIYGCQVGISRLRLNEECRLLGISLERLGSPGRYGVVDDRSLQVHEEEEKVFWLFLATAIVSGMFAFLASVAAATAVIGATGKLSSLFVTIAGTAVGLTTFCGFWSLRSFIRARIKYKNTY